MGGDLLATLHVCAITALVLWNRLERAGFFGVSPESLVSRNATEFLPNCKACEERGGRGIHGDGRGSGKRGLLGHRFRKTSGVYTVAHVVHYDFLCCTCACNGSTNVQDTLPYFVSNFIVDYAFLLYYGLLNGPQNSRTENARWQPRIAIYVRSIYVRSIEILLGRKLR